MTKQESAFVEWFNAAKKAHGIRYFSASEFINYFRRDRNGIKNQVPPSDLWENIIPTLKVADAIRHHFGKPCTLLSSYRGTGYNGAVGGVSGSQHKRFTALDITFDGIDTRDIYDTLNNWRDQGKWVGGLGLYVRSGFVHIDTRPYNANWRGN